MDEPRSIPYFQERLRKLQEWLDNPEYQAYLEGTRQSIINCKEDIVRTPPTTPEKISVCLLHHGKLDLLSDNLSLFENARIDLENQLSTLLDEATRIAQTPT